MTNDWLDSAEQKMEDAAAVIEKRQGAETWKPKEGDVLQGTLLDGDYYVGGSHGPVHVLTIEDKDGKVWTVWCGSALLVKAMSDEAPKVGKGIRIKFDGKKPPSKPGGYEWNAYYMVAEEADHEYWNEKVQSHNGYVARKEEEATGGSGAPFAAPSADPF